MNWDNPGMLQGSGGRGRTLLSSHPLFPLRMGNLSSLSLGHSSPSLYCCSWKPTQILAYCTARAGPGSRKLALVHWIKKHS